MKQNNIPHNELWCLLFWTVDAFLHSLPSSTDGTSHSPAAWDPAGLRSDQTHHACDTSNANQLSLLSWSDVTIDCCSEGYLVHWVCFYVRLILQKMSEWAIISINWFINLSEMTGWLYSLMSMLSLNSNIAPVKSNPGSNQANLGLVTSHL